MKNFFKMAFVALVFFVVGVAVAIGIVSYQFDQSAHPKPEVVPEKPIVLDLKSKTDFSQTLFLQKNEQWKSLKIEKTFHAYRPSGQFMHGSGKFAYYEVALWVDGKRFLLQKIEESLIASQNGINFLSQEKFVGIYEKPLVVLLHPEEESLLYSLDGGNQFFIVGLNTGPRQFFHNNFGSKWNDPIFGMDFVYPTVAGIVDWQNLPSTKQLVLSNFEKAFEKNWFELSYPQRSFVVDALDFIVSHSEDHEIQEKALPYFFQSQTREQDALPLHGEWFEVLAKALRDMVVKDEKLLNEFVVSLKTFDYPLKDHLMMYYQLIWAKDERVNSFLNKALYDQIASWEKVESLEKTSKKECDAFLESLDLLHAYALNFKKLPGDELQLYFELYQKGFCKTEFHLSRLALLSFYTNEKLAQTIQNAARDFTSRECEEKSQSVTSKAECYDFKTLCKSFVNDKESLQASLGDLKNSTRLPSQMHYSWQFKSTYNREDSQKPWSDLYQRRRNQANEARQASYLWKSWLQEPSCVVEVGNDLF